MLVGRQPELDAVVGALRVGTRSVVLAGATGVGKSALAAAAAGRLEAEGWHVEHVVATRAGASIPFGAFSDLVPGLPDAEPVVVLQAISRSIADRARELDLVLVVDDAPLLDPGSIALLHQLARDPSVGLAVTMRTDEPVPDTLVALWKDEHAERVDLEPLSRRAAAQLVEQVLGGPVAPALERRVWALGRGNPLFTREVLAAAREQGMVDAADGVWRRRGRLPATSARLREIVAGRLRALDPAAQAVLELVAVGEPLPLDLAARTGDDHAVEALETSGLVAVELVDGRRVLRTAHPVYAEVQKDLLPAARRSRLQRMLGELLVADGLGRAGDAVRAASLLSESGAPVGHALATTAAAEALARLDLPLAERLARLALDGGDGTGPRVVLGTSLSYQGRVEEADEHLARALTLARDDAELARAAIARARHVVWVEQRFSAGIELLRDAVDAIADPGRRAELRAQLAIFWAVAGDGHETVRIADEVLADPDAGPEARLAALVQSTLARTMLGDLAGLGDDLDRAEQLAARHVDALPLASHQLGVTRVLWQHFVDLAEAAELAADGHVAALGRQGPTGIWSVAAGWVAVDRGDLDLALEAFDRARVELEGFDPFRNAPTAEAGRALAHAMRGEVDAARTLLDELDVAALEPRSRAWADRALAWILASGGAPSTHAIGGRATQPGWPAVVLDGARRAEAADLRLWAGLLLHDSARLGAPDAVADELERLAGACDAPLVAAFAAHARAAAGRDPDAIWDAAEVLLALGAVLPAAEALARASHHAGEPAVAARAAARAAHLLDWCPGAATPAVQGLDVPLSPRVVEVARAAADGQSSRQIAEQLFLSPRTVDNHLAVAYRTLDLGGRAELRRVFPPRPRPAAARRP